MFMLSLGSITSVPRQVIQVFQIAAVDKTKMFHVKVHNFLDYGFWNYSFIKLFKR